jgi:hypothetical protein
VANFAVSWLCRPLKVMKTNRSFNKIPIPTSESGHTSLFSPNFAARLLRSLLATPGVLLEQTGVGNSSQNRKLLAIRTTRVQHVLASYVSFRNGWDIEHMVLLSSELAMLKDIPEVHTSHRYQSWV